MTHRRTLRLGAWSSKSKNHVNMTNCPASICRTLEKFHASICAVALISHCANIDLINRKEKYGTINI